ETFAGTFNLVNSTVSNNTSATNNGGGGGVDISGGVVNITNSTISGNASTVGNSNGGGVWSQGSLTISSSTITNNLAAGANSGGTTPTHALLAGSPAIDKGKSFGLTTDQRGFIRPVDIPSIPAAAGGDNSDIGAFEFQGCNPQVTSLADSGAGSLREAVGFAC